jgi:hypothetical protein
MTNIAYPISIHPPQSESDRIELSQLLEYLDRSPSEVNRRLQIIIRAILAGESISVVSQERNLSGESPQPQDKIRAESLREIIAMTEEEGGYDDDYIRSVMASIDE